MRFRQFQNIWIKKSLHDITKKINIKNKNKECKNVICNSAQLGLIKQIDFFDKEIAQDGSIENYTIIKKNDFVYNPRKSLNAPYGPVNIYNYEEAGIVSPLYLCFNVHDIDKIFLHYYFKSQAWYRFIYLNGDLGARHDRVSIKDEVFFSQNLYLPNAIEQEKIGVFLTLIDQRIDTQSKIIEDLELFEKEINNTIINKLVEYKDLVKFSSIYNFAKEGGTPNTSHPEYYTKGSIPFVKIDDLTTKYLVCNQSFITKLGLENSSAWLIPVNSILYSNGATIGAISINKYPVTTKQGILGIVPKSDYLSEYLYYFLRSNYFKKEICKITTLGTMKSAYIKDIDNILVPRINKNQQNEILTFLSEITLKIQQEKDILELYKKQKAYLLKNMFI